MQAHPTQTRSNTAQLWRLEQTVASAAPHAVRGIRSEDTSLAEENRHTPAVLNDCTNDAVSIQKEGVWGSDAKTDVQGHRRGDRARSTDTLRNLAAGTVTRDFARNYWVPNALRAVLVDTKACLAGTVGCTFGFLCKRSLIGTEFSQNQTESKWQPQHVTPTAKRNRMKLSAGVKVLFVLSLLVLPGCGAMLCRTGPMQQQYRDLVSEYEELQGNIERGYAIHVSYEYRTEPYSDSDLICAGQSVWGGCVWQYRTVTKYRQVPHRIEEPVAIDVAATRKKANQLHKRIQRTRVLANNEYNRCIAQ